MSKGPGEKGPEGAPMFRVFPGGKENPPWRVHRLKGPGDAREFVEFDLGFVTEHFHLGLKGVVGVKRREADSDGPRLELVPDAISHDLPEEYEAAASGPHVPSFRRAVAGVADRVKGRLRGAVARIFED